MVLALCPAARATLQAFVEGRRREAIEVRFAHFPFFAAQSVDPGGVRLAARDFERELSAVAPLIDTRAEVTFERAHFFDTGLHLNAEGRSRRTRALASSIHRDRELMARLRPDRP